MNITTTKGSAMRGIIVKPLSPERAAALLAAPAPKAEAPTRFASLSDREILALDLDPSLSKVDSIAITAEMSRRGLYGN